MPIALTVNTAATAMQMADAIFGTGVQIISASYSGAAAASGIYSGGTTTSPGVLPSATGVILSTGSATNFATGGLDPNTGPEMSTAWGTAGNSDLSALSGAPTYDAAVLNATFIPTGNVLTMQIVFSSDEYLEYVNSGFNDIVAIWVNGVQATLTVGTGDVSIDNINTTSNSNLYIDNNSTLDPAQAYNTQMDGFTVTLTLKADVVAGQQNTITFAIADSGDRLVDSNLIIVGDSVQVAVIANDDSLVKGKHGRATFDLRSNDYSANGSTLTITAINGIAITAGQAVTLSSGETIMLNFDGTITVSGPATIMESVFTYTVQNSTGTSDVGFVTLSTVACFCTGTWIATPEGPRRIESLTAGDLVLTRDHGPQPLRWVGQSLRRARGADAPVHLPAGVLGDHGALSLSQRHRVLVASAGLALCCGLDEALVPALHLAEAGLGHLAREGGLVLYHHLLFDHHEIIEANGLPCESYRPTAANAKGYDPDQQAEILRLFPALAEMPDAPPLPLARPVLRRHESRLIAGLAARSGHGAQGDEAPPRHAA